LYVLPCVLQEILRVLKPGACFAGYEWCATDRYDPTNQVRAAPALEQRLPC
jgi:hypothetical protein